MKRKFLIKYTALKMHTSQINQKADIIGKALRHVNDGTRKLPRKIQASLKRGARNIDKYQKKISETATVYMKRKLSKQRDN